MRAVVAFGAVGCGQAAIKEWSSMLNMPSCLSKQTYQNIAQRINSGAKQMFGKVKERTQKPLANLIVR